MDLGLADSTVLITGASGGIGWSCAEVLAGEGARLVLLAGRRADALEARVRNAGWSGQALCLGADVRDPAAVEQVFEQGVERFGRLDGVVASAGVWPAEGLRLDRMPLEQLRDTLEVNLLGCLWTARAFMRVLAAARESREGACLVLIGSTAGRFGEPGHVDYACSKAALRGLTLSLRREMAEVTPFGRVNLVEPGWTATEMAEQALEQPGAIESTLRTMPLRQIARPEDVARAVAWFLSPTCAGHVTGEVLTVAGGMDGRVAWEREQIDRNHVLSRLR